MAFLSGLFQTHPADDFSTAASSVVARVTAHPVPSPNAVAFAEALEAAHAKPLPASATASDSLLAISNLLEHQHFVQALVHARELMTRHPGTIASSLDVIGSVYFELHFYREAIRHFAAAARYESSFETMVNNVARVHQALHASASCKMSRLVLGVLASDAFDPVIDAPATGARELIGALLARGETARRLGAPHLAMLDFTRAATLDDKPSTSALIVLAASDMGDAEANALAPRARESAAFQELDARLSPVLHEWESVARVEWGGVLTKLEALE